jgi:hypothetical protein
MRRSAPLAIIHLVGNALILWLGYYWLGISESDGAHLAWSALVLVLFVVSALWLHGTALAMFDRELGPDFPTAVRSVGAHLIPLFSPCRAAYLQPRNYCGTRCLCLWR